MKALSLHKKPLSSTTAHHLLEHRDHLEEVSGAEK